MTTAQVTIRVTNDYSDGHHSESTEVIDGPEGDVDEWFEVVVYQYTGDGHGIDSELGSCYTATIIEAPDKALIGKEYEWVD